MVDESSKDGGNKGTTDAAIFVQRMRAKREAKIRHASPLSTTDNPVVEGIDSESEHLRGYTYFEQQLTDTAIAPQWSELVESHLLSGELNPRPILGMVSGDTVRWSQTAPFHSALVRLDPDKREDVRITIRSEHVSRQPVIIIDGNINDEEKAVQTVNYLKSNIQRYDGAQLSLRVYPKQEGILRGFEGLLSGFTGKLDTLK